MIRPSLATIALSAALAATAGYAVHEGHNVKQMSAQNAQVQASLKSTNQQIDQMSAKLAELSAPKPVPVVRASAPVARRVHHTRVADSRLKKMQSQLDANGQAIESTRADLNNTRTELQGSIARTHDELVVLQRKGERNYFEFDLDKSKQSQPEGPIGVRLRKANVKHQFADLDLLVDDASLTKKHINLYEPAVFYAAESDHPVEIVINRITKNHIHGYVSAPKFRRSELASITMGASSSGSAAVSSNTANSSDATPSSDTRSLKTRERLSLPK